MAKKRAPRPQEGPGADPIVLEWVDIRGLGAFDELFVRFPEPERGGQWIVLLGQNGCGKTTLLRSIALPLLRASVMSRCADDVDGEGVFFRGFGDAPGRFGARTTVSFHEVGDVFELSYGRRPKDLNWSTIRTLSRSDQPNPDRPTGLDDLNLPVFAYGSRRGDALGGPERDVDLAPHRAVGTLFNRDTRLIHAETWVRREKLRGTAGGDFLQAVLTTVGSLLPNGEVIHLEGDQLVVITPNGCRLPLAAMSDGYLTTLGWTIDLIARWADRYRDTGKLDENFAKEMPCVVLVDELDMHLHPKWQLDIIPRLRAAFPKTTFVVTTHNPLTLQGTRPGEVFVLSKDDDTGKVSIVQRDVPPGTDANRLLTGDWFGLGSTLDESTLKLLDDHRAMLLARRPENDPMRLKLEANLRTRLNGFADTSYERMALNVIAQLHDEKMRQRGDITDEDRERVVREVRARLAALDAPPTSAREPLPTFRPTKTKAKPRTSKPSAPKKKPVARTKRK